MFVLDGVLPSEVVIIGSVRILDDDVLFTGDSTSVSEQVILDSLCSRDIRLRIALDVCLFLPIREGILELLPQVGGRDLEAATSVKCMTDSPVTYVLFRRMFSSKTSTMETMLDAMLISLLARVTWKNVLAYFCEDFCDPLCPKEYHNDSLI